MSGNGEQRAPAPGSVKDRMTESVTVPSRLAEGRTILVSGATGQQGGAVARHLHQQGFHVRALTRNADQASARELADRDIEIVEGDFLDRHSLERALGGAWGAFSVQTFFEVGVEGEVRQGKAFAEAARDAGVEHFVYSSVGGAERSSGVPHFESKWEIEGHIRALGLPATVLRPTSFMENWGRAPKEAILGGKLPQPLRPATRLQQISVEDVGAFAALAFSDPDRWIGREIELAGDETSLTETAEIFSRVLGRPVVYAQLPWHRFLEQAGEEITTMYLWLEEEGYEADIPLLRKIHPSLLRLESFLDAQPWTGELREKQEPTE
jgi:uncharacterized protein YbjT (DUF2867 family)